ncbi:MAG: hydrogenase formation protein HypD [Candidatus Brocadiales bacterium]
MKYVDEYRDSEPVRKYIGAITDTVKREWSIMEVCGGQTHNIIKFGIDTILPDKITLIHGPGCPVCVTPIEMLDKAVHIASLPDVIFCSFGDMLRVPGSKRNLITSRAEGADIRILYSPLDAIKIARESPGKKVVFFSVGFEATAPAVAMAILQAKKLGIKNFYALVAHVLVPPALEAILSTPNMALDGFLAPGHVSTVIGERDYERITGKYHVPIVITGFEPLDILFGIYKAVKQLEEGRCEVENAYARSARPEGNVLARQAVDEVFEAADRKWRGIGVIPESGLALKESYRDFDAECQFNVDGLEVEEPAECIAGYILQGLKRPNECPAFGTRCTPLSPLGAPMVSAEGACAAYYNYRRV